MTAKKKRQLMLLAALPIVIFFLLFVPIVLNMGAQQIVYDAVGFRENSADPFALENNILIQGRETLNIVVHREWSAQRVTITTSTDGNIKAILKQKGHVDIILGEVTNVKSATFANEYSSENGEITYKAMPLSNHLDVDAESYYPLTNIDVWIEVIVDVSEPTVVTVELTEELV